MEQDLIWNLGLTAKALRLDFERRAAAHGITRAQWKVLVWLSRAPDLKQVELADRLEIEPITLCRQLDRLAEAGLVERHPDPNDRRAWRLKLTDKAAPLLADLRDMAEALTANAFTGFTAAERAGLDALLARIRTNLADPADRKLSA